MSYQNGNKNNFLQQLSTSDIKKQFINIFDKLQNSNTKSVAYDIYQKLVKQCIFTENQMFFIIQQISDFLLSFNHSEKEKDAALKLLSLTFNTDNQDINKSIYYKYVSYVLSVFQSLIMDSNNNLFQSISNTFSDIVQYILPTDIETSHTMLEIEEKRVYEILQGFCFYNMSMEDKANRLCGSLCLIKLVENCPIVIHEEYLKIIWENVTNYLEKPNYNAKYELLNCLISLILGAEENFKPYANSTLYKVFEFLTDNDWIKRKLSLNVIYTVIHYCKDEIMPLKDYLIGFLKLLKCDKVKEVREICLLILDIFNKDNKNRISSSTKSLGEMRNSSANVSSTNITQSISTAKANKRFVKKINVNDDNEEIKNKRNNNSRMKSFGGKDFILVEKNESTPTNKNKEKKIRAFTPNRINIKRNLSNNNIPMMTSNEDIIDEINHTTSNMKSSKNIINRKNDKSFVNEKMIIKHDPSKSIFKTSPNKAFFTKAKKQPDIIVLDKKKDIQIDMSNNNEEIKNNIQEKEEIVNIKEENIQIENNNDEDVKMKENSQNEISFSSPSKFQTKYQSSSKRQIQDINTVATTTAGTNTNNGNIDINSNNVEKPKNIQKNNNSSVVINTLLAEMNSLSSKQLILLDTIDKIKSDSTKEINNLNAKISSLENILSSLSNQLKELKASNNSKIIKETKQEGQNTIYNNKYNEAFKISLNSNNDEYLIHLISTTPMNELGDVDINYLEKTLIRLINSLSKGVYMKEIISFYKTIILCLKCPLKSAIIQNIKDILEYIVENNDNNYHLNNSELIDISIILSSFDK